MEKTNKEIDFIIRGYYRELRDVTKILISNVTELNDLMNGICPDCKEIDELVSMRKSDTLYSLTKEKEILDRIKYWEAVRDGNNIIE